MSTAKTNFADSEYFVSDVDNWHLEEGAPEEVQEEFDEYMEYSKECEERGIFI